MHWKGSKIYCKTQKETNKKNYKQQNSSADSNFISGHVSSVWNDNIYFKAVLRKKQAVVRGTTNPAPCCHLANDTDLLTPVVWAMAGNNEQIDLWPELNPVVPWSLDSLHTFPENFVQIGPAVFSKCCWQRNKEIAGKQYPVPLPGAG